MRKKPVKKKPLETWQAARTRREIAQANRAELELEEKLGQVISRAKVEAEAFTTGRIIRDKLQNIPDRLCHALVGKTDAENIRLYLADEIRAILQELVTEQEKYHAR